MTKGVQYTFTLAAVNERFDTVSVHMTKKQAIILIARLAKQLENEASIPEDDYRLELCGKFSRERQ
jgi:hypothetical protein